MLTSLFQAMDLWASRRTPLVVVFWMGSWGFISGISIPEVRVTGLMTAFSALFSWATSMLVVRVRGESFISRQACVYVFFYLLLAYCTESFLSTPRALYWVPVSAFSLIWISGGVSEMRSLSRSSCDEIS